MDGAIPAIAGSRLPRLLRRGLLVAAVAAVAWLLSVLFATGAAAQGDPDLAAPQGETAAESPLVEREAPAPPASDAQQDPQQETSPEPQVEPEIEPPAETESAPQIDSREEAPSGGLLGGLLDGVTHTLTGVTHTVVALTDTVVDTTASLLAQGGSILDLPGPLRAPEDDAPIQEEPEGPVEAPQDLPVPVAPVATPVAPTPVQVEATIPQAHTSPVVTVRAERPVSPAVVQDTVVSQELLVVVEHVDPGTSDPQPTKAPAAPTAPGGSSVSMGHDTSGGARGAVGVLTTQAVFQPSDAGFTTRSRAVDAAGREAGLPAASPD